MLQASRRSVASGTIGSSQYHLMGDKAGGGATVFGVVAVVAQYRRGLWEPQGPKLPRTEDSR